MKIFALTLEQLLMIMMLVLVGFFLRKKEFIPSNSGIVLSKLELLIFAPALAFKNQLQNCTVQNFTENLSLVLYGLVFVSIAVAISYPLSRLFVRNFKDSSELDYKRNIYKYAITFGNFSFFGNFVVLGIWGPEMLFKYLMFTFFLQVFCHSWGLYILIPKGQSSFLINLKKSLTTPPILALILGVICGLLNVQQYIPGFAISVLDNLSNCMGPVAMLLAGIVIGEYDIKELLKNKRVYVASFLRLIVIPAFFLMILRLVGASEEITVLLLIAFAAPLGMNTIVFPAAYGGETKTGAAMVVISQVLSLATIPLMYYFFVTVL